jgi:hypothetical protein
MNNVIHFPVPQGFTDEDVGWVLGDHIPDGEITDGDSDTFWSL